MFLTNKGDIMQITKNFVKLGNHLVRIPKACKRIWDLSDNRWGYSKVKKDS